LGKKKELPFRETKEKIIPRETGPSRSLKHGGGEGGTTLGKKVGLN